LLDFYEDEQLCRINDLNIPEFIFSVDDSRGDAGACLGKDKKKKYEHTKYTIQMFSCQLHVAVATASKSI
jgi:hypothetical protein